MSLWLDIDFTNFTLRPKRRFKCIGNSLFDPVWSTLLSVRRRLERDSCDIDYGVEMK